MATTALILYVTFAAVAFGWRSWIQYRRTGSTGFRGISGPPGSLRWWAGVGFIAAILAGLAAPLLQLFGILTPLVILQNIWIQVSGVMLAGAGIAVTVYAQRDMGLSWRIGVDPDETTHLVRGGVFRLVRNPIFTGMLIFAAGISIITPNPLAMAAFAMLLATIEVQVRVVEEPYLDTVHGQAYRAYCATVGRFVPYVGRT